MELKEFISETLKQMIDGVNSAIEYARENNASINQENFEPLTKSGDFAMNSTVGGYANIVKFDIAIYTGETSGGKGAGGIFVGPVGIGVQHSDEFQSNTHSRIQFSLPIRLPRQELPEIEQRARQRNY